MPHEVARLMYMVALEKVTTNMVDGVAPDSLA
jgi:hypothetical protein